MKYRWLVPALGRKVDAVEEIEDARVEVWCKAGMIEPVKATRAKPKTEEKPAETGDGDG